jgi:Protein of unknown function (DUF2510)
MAGFRPWGIDMAAEAGWYNDPEYPSQLRWWNGSEWTAHRTPAQAAPAFVAPAAYVAPQPFVAQQPTARQPRSRGWLWIVGGVAVAGLVIGTTFASGHLTFGPETTSSSTQNASSGSQVTTPQLSDIAAFGTPGAPKGMTSTGATQNSAPTTAGQVLQDTSQAGSVPISIPACSGLLYQAPITADDEGSTDPVIAFPDYRGTDGSASLEVQGEVRQYPSTAAAAQSFSAMSALDQKCSKGFSSSGGVVKVLSVSGNWPGTTTLQWEQILPIGNDATIEISTFSMLRGSVIVRGDCDYNTATSALTGECLNWMSILDDSIVRVAN